ncbi:MAG: SMC-Scp complex subunit ScpB [Coriobacteriales bacterium]|nr:SMC-Scp complex subunit ScpB [Coriobacteriales bacterium]
MARDEAHAELMGAAEALLFVSDEPVSSAKLAAILEISPVEMDEVLTELAAEYADENRGMQLREVAGGWRFYSHPAYHDLIERYVISWDTRRLSQAGLEVLAIIAYHQPVTRAGINAIRGVNSEGVVSSLVEKGLVREMGRDDAPGNAILYGTTRSFLERFGLKSVKDLPPLEDFAPDEESREYIRERLSGMDEQRRQMSFDEEDELDERGLDVRLVNADGSARVEEVDRGDDERHDDPEALAAIIGSAITEKADAAFAGMRAVAGGQADAAGDEYEEDDEEDIPTIE